MTTRLRSLNSSKGFPVNYCSGFRSLNVASAHEVDGVYLAMTFVFHFTILYVLLCKVYRYVNSLGYFHESIALKHSSSLLIYLKSDLSMVQVCHVSVSISR